jgi:hypothetical protein
MSTYHWIMTLQWPQGMVTGDGLIDVSPRTTRSEVFQKIYDDLIRGRAPRGAHVTFFALEPNSLT